jgi:hypothetical protein
MKIIHFDCYSYDEEGQRVIRGYMGFGSYELIYYVFEWKIIMSYSNNSTMKLLLKTISNMYFPFVAV